MSVQFFYKPVNVFPQQTNVKTDVPILSAILLGGEGEDRSGCRD